MVNLNEWSKYYKSATLEECKIEGFYMDEYGDRPPIFKYYLNLEFVGYAIPKDEFDNKVFQEYDLLFIVKDNKLHDITLMIDRGNMLYDVDFQMIDAMVKQNI